ncbi:MAG: septum formation initiator family protein [Lachnospiraceae bacterium]|nr:septum formation initiator family protein [Lachnospiraceae bacterium]
MRSGRGNNPHKKKAAMYRRIRHNRPAVFGITIIVALLLVVISVDSKTLSEKRKALNEKEMELTSQLESEQARTEELDEFEKYTKTKKYAEEMAKKKLGLVHENEIIFKTEDGK